MTYEELARELGKTVDQKQQAYGDSFGKAGQAFRILYPNDVSLEHYDDLLAVTRVVDKLFRVATDKGAFGESAWEDIHGYSVLAVGKNKELDWQETTWCPDCFKVVPKDHECDAGSCGDDVKECSLCGSSMMGWSNPDYCCNPDCKGTGEVNAE